MVTLCSFARSMSPCGSCCFGAPIPAAVIATRIRDLAVKVTGLHFLSIGQCSSPACTRKPRSVTFHFKICFIYKEEFSQKCQWEWQQIKSQQQFLNGTSFFKYHLVTSGYFPSLPLSSCLVKSQLEMMLRSLPCLSASLIVERRVLTALCMRGDPLGELQSPAAGAPSPTTHTAAVGPGPK